MKIKYSIFLTIAIIASCYSNKKMQKTQQQLIKKDSMLNALQIKGIDFIATGKALNTWSLTIDIDKTIEFIDANNTSIRCTPVNPVTLPDGSEIYNVKSGNTGLKIHISKNLTNNVQNSSPNKKSVEVLYNGNQYKGDGAFTHPVALHERWILEKIGSTNYSNKNSFYRHPKITFDLLQNKVKGYNGYTHFNGDIEIRGDYIKFSSFSKKRNKVFANQISQLFDTQIENHLLEYYIRDNYLIIILNDDRRLTFKKINDH